MKHILTGLTLTASLLLTGCGEEKALKDSFIELSVAMKHGTTYSDLGRRIVDAHTNLVKAQHSLSSQELEVTRRALFKAELVQELWGLQFESRCTQLCFKDLKRLVFELGLVSRQTETEKYLLEFGINHETVGYNWEFQRDGVLPIFVKAGMTNAARVADEAVSEL